MRQFTLCIFVLTSLAAFACGNDNSGSAEMPLSSADVCTDYVNAGADQQAKGQSS